MPASGQSIGPCCHPVEPHLPTAVGGPLIHSTVHVLRTVSSWMPRDYRHWVRLEPKVLWREPISHALSRMLVVYESRKPVGQLRVTSYVAQYEEQPNYDPTTDVGHGNSSPERSDHSICLPVDSLSGRSREFVSDAFVLLVCQAREVLSVAH